MAEIFGVVAGAVGLLHLTAKAANILRGIPEIEDDFQELCEEIEAISSWVDHAKLTISPVAAIVPLAGHQLLLIARRLENISQSLREIEERLKKETPNGGLKVKKATWLINSGKIAKLLQKAQRAKADLSLAIQCQQHSQLSYLVNISDGISQGLVRSEQIMSTTLHHVTVLADKYPPSGPRLGQKQQRRVEELANSSTEADSERQVATMSFKKRSRQAMSSCPKGCACGCHRGSGKQRQKVDLMNIVLRYMGVHYDTPPWGSWEPRCRCRGAWIMKYHPPWLRARVWILSGNHHAPSPIFSLRAARILPYQDPIWTGILNIGQTSHRLRDSIMSGTKVYPDDRSEIGFDVIEVVIRNFNFAALELLLTEWANILPLQGLSKRAGWEANLTLLGGGDVLDEGKMRLLQQVVAFAEIDDDDNEAATLKVHEAAMQGLGMADALAASQSWAKDALDNTGRAPLHWAASKGHGEALQQLIDAGADVDIRNVNGWTPFMIAASQDNTDCMCQLLMAGCRVDQRNNDNWTVLHIAAIYGSKGAVRFLLSEGHEGRYPGAVGRMRAGRGMASVTTHYTRDLPLHQLTGSLQPRKSPEAVEEIAQLLIDAYPEGLNQRDMDGATPAMLAVMVDNLPLMRYLARAGASFDVVISLYSLNVLHFAAGCSTAPALRFLLEECLAGDSEGENQRPPPNIDHRLRDAWGNTPWDVFVSYLLVMPRYLTRNTRRPDTQTRHAFVSLYLSIRDRNIRHDTSVLRAVLDALSANDGHAAREHLSRLVKRKADASSDSAALYRAFMKQIDDDEWEAALSGIEKDLEDLNEELESSPGDQMANLENYGVDVSQWFDLPHTSFWIEPADAILADEDAASHGRLLDYDRITQIYSCRGKLTYDRETSSEDPRECIKRFSHISHDD